MINEEGINAVAINAVEEPPPPPQPVVNGLVRNRRRRLGGQR